MILDINKYIINKKFIQDMYLNAGAGTHLGTLISSLACCTMCPCIVVAYWVGEVSNWHPDTVNSIKTLMKFYGYTNILNKPDGAPL